MIQENPFSIIQEAMLAAGQLKELRMVIEQHLAEQKGMYIMPQPGDFWAVYVRVPGVKEPKQVFRSASYAACVEAVLKAPMVKPMPIEKGSPDATSRTDGAGTQNSESAG